MTSNCVHILGTISPGTENLWTLIFAHCIKFPTSRWLKTTEIYRLSSKGQKSEIKVSAGLCSSWGLRWGICPCLSPSFWQLADIFGDPSFVMTPISASVFTWCSLLCLRVSSLLTRTPVILNKDTPYSSMASSQLIMSAMTLFPNKATLWGPGGYNFNTWVFLEAGGYSLTHSS